MKPTKAQYAKYMANRSILEGMKEQNDGVIGVSRETKIRNGIVHTVYVSRMPSAIGRKTKSFDHPLKACMHYNMTMRALFGKDAILCDPLAVVRRFLLDAKVS